MTDRARRLATLGLGLASLGAWVVLGFIIPLGTGAIHLLLPVGVLALMRWVVVE